MELVWRGGAVTALPSRKLPKLMAATRCKRVALQAGSPGDGVRSKDTTFYCTHKNQSQSYRHIFGILVDAS